MKQEKATDVIRLHWENTQRWWRYVAEEWDLPCFLASLHACLRPSSSYLSSFFLNSPQREQVLTLLQFKKKKKKWQERKEKQSQTICLFTSFKLNPILVLIRIHPTYPSCFFPILAILLALSTRHSNIHLFTHLFVIWDVSASSLYSASPLCILPLLIFVCHFLVLIFAPPFLFRPSILCNLLPFIHL